jgi:glucans biosynthesis protein
LRSGRIALNPARQAQGPDAEERPLLLNRRDAVSALFALTATAPSLAAGAPSRQGAWPDEVALGPVRPFSFDWLKARAAELARRPAEAPPAASTGAHAIDYDAFGAITYRPEATLWGALQGDHGVRFFPIGRYAPRPVAMHVAAGGEAREVLYSPKLFEAPAGSPFEALGAQGGFAGFRVMNADHQTDWIAYLGASYFRSSDPFNQYGLSARGLAIDTAAAGPEEFPLFTAFWLENAPEGLVVYALLEGPSVTGAFRIAHRRSPAGLRQDISTALFFRRPVMRLGVAPLTSMYWYGRSDRPANADWRPQIHDSDGLELWTGTGERIWRPLANPPRVITNAFQDRRPRGFGLMQRDRNFADYQDDGVFYDRRPSAWVEPAGDWGSGSVQLVEIPTTGEADDNIVAFWTPALPITAGQTLELGYRLYWADEEPQPLQVAKVIATRSGRGGRPGQPPKAGVRKFVVDFAGPVLEGLTRESGVEPVVSLSRGAAIDAAAYPVVGLRGVWRLMFDVNAPPGEVLDLRAYLKRGPAALTETWLSQIAG